MNRLFALLLLHAAAAVSAGEMQVSEATLMLAPERAVFRASAQFDLDQPVRDALLNAIPVSFAWELQLVDKRTLLPDEILWSAEGAFRLSYRSLSRRYTLVQTDTGDERSYPDLAPALADLQSLVLELPPLDRVLTAGERTRLRFRYHLDIAALPPSMRLPGYLSEAWRLDSGWLSTSNIRHEEAAGDDSG